MKQKRLDLLRLAAKIKKMKLDEEAVYLGDLRNQRQIAGQHLESMVDSMKIDRVALPIEQSILASSFLRVTTHKIAEAEKRIASLDNVTNRQERVVLEKFSDHKSVENAINLFIEKERRAEKIRERSEQDDLSLMRLKRKS